MAHFQCTNCNAKIPPEWVHAIQSNVCPGCSKPIMDENMASLLKGLTEAMEKMPNDPRGVAGWLLANYRVEKVGDGEPTGFHIAKQKEEVVSGVVHSKEKKEKLAEFFERAGAPTNLIGASKKDLLREKGDLIDVSDPNLIDQRFTGVDINNFINSDDEDNSISSTEIMEPGELGDLPEDENMPPQLKALLMKQANKQQRAYHNVSSGVIVNKNGFVRSGG